MLFNNWNISGCVKFRMLDNKTSSFDVSGDIPEGWSWQLLYSCNGNLNIVEMQHEENILSVIFTKEMLPTDGTYLFQLKATKDDLVKHTNIVKTYVNKSLSGDMNWPVIPTEFTQIEQAVKGYAESAKESSIKAENAAVHSPIVGENGNWFIWDFEKSEYVDSGNPASIGGGSDLSLGITGAQVEQIAKITAVDIDGKPTKWEPVDIPNNEKLIVRFSVEGIHCVCDKTMDEIVNAYENGQDISAYFTGTSESGNQYTDLILCLTTYSPYEYIEFKSDIEMYKLLRIVAYIDGSGGCGVFEETALDDSFTNNSMAANAKAVGDALSRKQDILIQSGAAIGQIAKITEVDETGKPTAWEAVDMPSGGGGETWELIAEIDFDVDAANDVSVWEYKNLPNYKELAYRKVSLVGSTETASGLAISINNSVASFSSIQYAKKGGQSNGWGKILLLPFGWIHVNSGSANSPTNYSYSGVQAMYNAIPVDGDSITSVRLTSHTVYKIAGGKLSLYGRR